MRFAAILFLAVFLLSAAAFADPPATKNATITPTPSPQPALENIRQDYLAVSAELNRHLVENQWIDDDPASPALLARQWSLGAEWVAAWLNAHPQMTFEGVDSAITDLAPAAKPEYLALNPATFLVVAPGPIGNVFIVTKTGDHYAVAWSTAQPQQAGGPSADVLAAWQAVNARHGNRGPYWAASGNAGPVSPKLGMLPSDAKGHARFYIEGTYAQSAGATVGEQISLWLWDGVTAHPLLTRDYQIMVEQNVGTRLEGDLLKVQQKKFFRTFYTCGDCEGRQMDWTVRIAPDGMQDLGEKSTVPGLDAVDELFFRLIHGQPAADMASPAAIKAARKIIDASRREYFPREKKDLPNLGMLMEWLMVKDKDDDVLSFNSDDTGTLLFRMKPSGDGFYIEDITKQ